MVLHQPSDLERPVLEQFSLAGKICLVTGGSRGIGYRVVQALAEAGADVAFIYKSNPDSDQAAQTLSIATGVRVKAFRCDVTNREETRTIINAIADDFGRGKLDVVVANAGVCSNFEALDYDENSWGHINSVNYDGAMWTAMAAGAIFKRQGHGNLIFTASVSAHIVNVPQRQVAYNASKAAVLQLARGLAVEWTDFARVNCVSPGYVWTEILSSQPKERMDEWIRQIPASRLCDPAELKGVYVFLASDACPYMTGANLVVDGALTIP